MTHGTTSNIKLIQILKILFIAGNNPPSKQVNGFWFHSSQGHQLLKLAMGEEALSANCIVKTASGTHYLKYNRWGDTRQRFVPYKGKPMGRKICGEVSRYHRDLARKMGIERSEVYPIHRNSSPPRNWRASGLRDTNPRIRGRKLYTPEVEDVSDEEAPRNGGQALLQERRGRRTSYKEREARVTFGHFSNSKRGRTPSPDESCKKRQGKEGLKLLHPLRRAAPLNSLRAASKAESGSEDTDSVPELEGPEAPPTIRMTGDSPQSPSPTPGDQKKDKGLGKLSKDREAILEKIRKLDEESAELDRLLEKAHQGCDKIDKGLAELPRDREVDQAIQDKQNIEKWLADVDKARAEGGPIPDQPESQLQYREETPQKEDPGKDTNKELDKEEGPEDDEEHTDTQGPQQDERPPVPIEAKVIIVNQPPPQPETSKVKEGEANLEDKEEGDSDCQIVDVSPGREEPLKAEAPRALSTPSAPKGLWRLKKSRETSVTLQLIPDVCRDAPEREVPPTPGPAPSMENPLKNLSGKKASEKDGNNQEDSEKQE